MNVVTICFGQNNEVTVWIENLTKMTTWTLPKKSVTKTLPKELAKKKKTHQKEPMISNHVAVVYLLLQKWERN